MTFSLEGVSSAAKNISYYFIPATDERYAQDLIIIFSAIQPPNVFKYNYINTLEEIPTNKLFILDNFGDQGAYYIGEHGDFSIDSSVASLIFHFVATLNISLRNVTTMGSSKGGYSALYFAIKYSFGKVLALAPQTLLGNFLKDNYPNVMRYIIGSDDEKAVKQLNQLLFDLVQENRDTLPEINLMVGTKDSHKNRHVDPFVKFLNEKGINYKYDVIEEVNHSE